MFDGDKYLSQTQARYGDDHLYGHSRRQTGYGRRPPQQAALALTVDKQLKTRGFTLVELLISMVVLSILGVALTRILINDSRFVSQQDAMLDARQVARAAMNVTLSELRGVGDSGLLAATPDSVSIRLPYAFGVTCRTTGSRTYASIMPPDSLMLATAQLAGLAWLDSSGVYQYLTGVTVVDTSPSLSQCTNADVKVPPGGFAVRIQPPTSIPEGHIFYLYQSISYWFGTSTELPGRVALWRRVGTSTAEELVAPFDSTAGFGFLLGPDLTVSDTVPANLETVRGLELRFIGTSEHAPQGQSDPKVFQLITRIPFTNKQ